MAKATAKKKAIEVDGNEMKLAAHINISIGFPTNATN